MDSSSNIDAVPNWHRWSETSSAIADFCGQPDRETTTRAKQTQASTLAESEAQYLLDQACPILDLPFDEDLAIPRDTRGTNSFNTRENNEEAPCYYGSFNPTINCELPLTFRNQHRFLDRVYNAYPDPDQISAKRLGEVARQAGISMEEVLLWFGDEKKRRGKLLVSTHNPIIPNIPLSPDVTSPSATTATFARSPYSVNSPADFSQLQDILSVLSPSASATDQLVPLRARRGRPPRSGINSPYPSSPEAKRQKVSVNYPCVECGRCFAAERWSEHMKRVHFPAEVWECPKFNTRNGSPCASLSVKPFFRPDNFVTHLRTEHDCEDDEVAILKVTCRYEVFDFFHKVCGICGIELNSREICIEHIREHFKNISRRLDPPKDLGASEWTEQCGVEHRLQRGIHYQLKAKIEEVPTVDQNDQRNGGSGPDEGGGSGPDFSDGRGQEPGNPENGLDNEHSDEGNPYSTYYSDFMGFRQCFTNREGTNGKEFDFVDEFDEITPPFISLRILHQGIHSLIDQVRSSCGKVTYARKAIPRTISINDKTALVLELQHASNLSKMLKHPHLLQLMGTHVDDDFSYILVSPVTDYNLADYMRLKSDPNSHLLKWTSCLSSTVDYLHHLDIHNLNICPENILVKGESVFLTEFTTSRCVYQFDAMASLPEESIYSSPECAARHIRDSKADIWSLGCLFSEILSRLALVALDEFDNFREMEDEKAFHSTLPKVQTWIGNVLPNIFENLPGTQPVSWSSFEILQQATLAMLCENPQQRPSAEEVYQKVKGLEPCSSCGFIEITPAVAVPMDVFPSNHDQPLQSYNGSEEQPSTIPVDYPFDVSCSYMLPGPQALDSHDGFDCQEYLRTCGNHIGAVKKYILDPHSPRLIADHELLMAYSIPSVSDKDHMTNKIALIWGDGASTPIHWDSHVVQDPMTPQLSHSSDLSQETSSVSEPWSFYDGPPTSLQLRASSYAESYEQDSGPAFSANSGSSIFSAPPSKEGRCPQVQCSRYFKDLNAHMLTHTVSRPEKCPIVTCDYHHKGFARKYDKNRHTLTHYKGSLFCPFCHAIDSTAKKSFNRADVFKRHLTSVHRVEQSLTKARAKAKSTATAPTLGTAPGRGTCSTCSRDFADAQRFYEHLDECVLQVVQQQVAPEATNMTVSITTPHLLAGKCETSSYHAIRGFENAVAGIGVGIGAALSTGLILEE